MNKSEIIEICKKYKINNSLDYEKYKKKELRKSKIKHLKSLCK